MERKGDGPSKVICFFPFLESIGELMADPFAKFNPIKPPRLLRKSDTIVRIMVLLSYGFFLFVVEDVNFLAQVLMSREYIYIHL